jgi:hypothetical protein
MAALFGHRGADGMRAAIQHPCLVLAAAPHQQRIQRIKVGDTRHGHQVIAPEIAAFALDATLLVPFARRAEFRGKPPMRAERDKPHRLFAPVTAQDFAHRTRQIIVTQQLKYAAEVGEGVLVRLEEGLLRGMQISPVERRPARHRAHREHLHLGPLIAEIDPGLIPVDLRLLSPTVTLRHKRLAPFQSHLAFTLAHVVAHRRLGDRCVGELSQDPPMNAPGGVALLARRATVLVKHLVDELRHRPQLRLGPLWVMLHRRQRAADRPPHDAPMNTKLRGHARDRADPKLVLPTELLEQFHFGFPVHERPPDPIGLTVGSRTGGGPRLASTPGPKFDSIATHGGSCLSNVRRIGR